MNAKYLKKNSLLIEQVDVSVYLKLKQFENKIDENLKGNCFCN